MLVNMKEMLAKLTEKSYTLVFNKSESLYEEEAKLEKQKAYDEMKNEMIQIASMMAGKVVRASIDTDIQNSLVEETLKEVGEKTWQS